MSDPYTRNAADSQRKDREQIVSFKSFLKIPPQQREIFSFSHPPIFNGDPVKRHRTDAPDDNESQKPLRSPSPKTRNNRRNVYI